MICKVIRQFLKNGAAVCALVSFSHRTLAQDAGTYRSDIDMQFSVEKVSVLPFTDNLQGIYARPLEQHFIQLIDKMHRWDYLPANNTGPILTPEELEAAPAKTIQSTQGLGVDAVFAARISKGPNGVMIHLSLFLSKDGKLLSQAILKDYKQFDLNDLKEQMQRLLSEITARLPYAGRVLSREVNRVTVNLGAKDGLQAGQMLSVVQIVKANRHPKFNFLISTEKEIVGKIKVLKVDETLSFGTVVTEREKGTVQKNAKIGPLDFITYSNTDSLSLQPSDEEALMQKEGSKIAFGKDAREWQPQNAPTFGQVGGRLGLSRFTNNAQVTGVGGLSGTDNYAPGISLEGEIWITPEWTFHARLEQSIISVNNPRPGSQPAKLSQSLSAYEALVGYMIRLGPSVWSAYAEPFIGYFNYNLYTDNSTPEAFTSMDYSGLKFGIRGAAPIDPEGRYGVGGEFAIAMKPGLSEKPVTSGSSSTNNATEFGIFGYKRLSNRLKAQVNLDFEMYSSNFSGTGTRAQSATSASQRITTLSGGVYYMF